MDKSGLGRWASVGIRGKGNHTTRIIVAYCPVPGGVESSVFSQQERFWIKQGKRRDPIQAFDEDLEQVVKDFQKNGQAVIVMLDANDDVRQGKLQATLKRRGLTETISNCHGMNGPETYIRNTKMKPIDGIFTSASIDTKNCGYFGYGQSFGQDHQLIWASFLETSVLGLKMSSFERRKSI